MPTEPRRPNILFLMTDQHRHDALGCVDARIKTPTLDAIAARGVRFSQAVCNVPMCVPSRYAMMTGLYGFQLGVKHNTQMLPTDADLPVTPLPQLMLDAGYQTAGFGKTHWYIGERCMPNTPIEGSKRGFEIRALRGARTPLNDEPDSVYRAEEEPEWHARLGEESKKSGPGGETVTGYIGETSAIPPEQHAEAWLTRKALDFLDNQRDPSHPFFLYLSFDYPHVGLHVPPGFEDLYDIKDFPDNPPPEPMPPGHRTGSFEDRWPKMTPEQHRQSRLRYAAICTFVDGLFGQVIEKLRSAGELENTFILFTSDHGDMMGDRGRVTKYSLYDGSVRVPLMIAGAEVDRCGVVDDRPAELVDVVPTLLDVSGTDVPETLPGFSLLSDYSRVAAFAEMHGRGYEEYQRAPAVMFRSKEWKIILYLPGPLGEAYHDYDRIAGELYDLEKDPLELNNLYDDPSSAEVRGRMTTQLLMHVMCSLGKYPSAPGRAGIRVTGPETKPDSSIW